MSAETIQLAYDGEALRTGAMDVRDLAPALLAIGKICERANAVLNEDRAEVSVKVRSDFKTGSFELHIDVSQSLIETAKLIFTHKDQITTAKELLEIIGLVAGGVSVSSVGLFKLIKWLKGRKAIKTIILESGATRIYVDNSTNIDNSINLHIDVIPGVVSLYNDKEVMEAALGIVKPLESEGIDTLEVREKNCTFDIIKQEDLPSFTNLSSAVPELPLVETERDAAFVVIKPSFEDDLKWMFSDGEARFSASMMDVNFLDKLSNRQISFTKGDVLVVRLSSKSFQTTTGIRTEHKILEVIDIKHVPKQTSFFPLPPVEENN